MVKKHLACLCCLYRCAYKVTKIILTNLTQQKEKQNEDYRKMLAELEKKVLHLQKESEIEQRLKLEAVREKEKCQKWFQELIADNEKMLRSHMQYQDDLGQLHEEQRELMQEYDVIASGNDGKISLETRLFQKEEFQERKFTDNGVNSVNEEEGYHEECAGLQAKCRDYERQLQNAIYDLDVAGKELATVKSHKQADIDRLTHEKDTLKTDLKLKESLLQRLEASNGELELQLKKKKKQIESLKKGRHPFNDEKAQAFDYIEIEKDFLEKCQQVEEHQENARVPTESTSSQKERGIALEEEILHLRTQLNKLEGEKSVREKEMCDLKSANEELKEYVKVVEDEKHNLSTSLKVSKSEGFGKDDEHKSRKNINSNEAKVRKLMKKNQVLMDEIGKQRDQHATEMIAIKDELGRYKAYVEKIGSSNAKLNAASVEQERHGLDEKLDEVLKANSAIQTRCNKIETLLSEKEGQLTQLKFILEERNLNEQDLPKGKMPTVAGLEDDLSDSKKEIVMLTAKISELESELLQRHNALREAEEKRMKLAKQHRFLSKKLKEKKKVLDDNNEQLKSAKEYTKELEDSLKDLNAVCDKLKNELDLERQGGRSSQAKPGDLLRKVDKAAKGTGFFEKENEKVRRNP